MTKADTAPSRVRHLPADPPGVDPLVGGYLQRFRATSAVVVLSWPMILLGGLAVLLGGLAGDWLAGDPPPPPLWMEPERLAGTWRWLVHDLAGNPWGVLAGMAGGAAVAGIVGAVWRPKGVPAAQEPWMAATVLAPAYLACFDPLVAASVVTAVICSIYLVAIGYRLLALTVSKRGHFAVESVPECDWPVYTVLVPMYREEEVARTIISRMEKLDYPRDKLDVKILLEADDPGTLAAIEAVGIPDWAEVLVVPEAQPKTKPRACNHGLAHARGEFLVIFDAEDRPESDQLKKAVAAFRRLDPACACLQAQLAYHNHDQNLLTRWFALEYNVWFQRYLGGLNRFGGPLPLGGTSNHFRTVVLAELGGWDPFNVTEDCDLGIRLAAAGYRTDVLHSVTWEEANSRLGNWLRQRSRWLKGYMVTHLVWNRRPLATWWALGRRPRGATGTLGGILHLLLRPLWSSLAVVRFWLAIFGVAGLSLLNLPLWIVLAWYLVAIGIDLGQGWGLVELMTTPPSWGDGRWSWPMIYAGYDQDPFWSRLSVVFTLVSVALLVANLLFVLINVCFGRRPGQRGLRVPALLTPFYWVLISIGAWKAFWQLLVKPHYWEKTVHNLDQAYQARKAREAGQDVSVT